MATSATVTEITGRAWVRQPDGSLLELSPGSVIPPNTEVVTAPGATVTLAIDGAVPITIGESRSVAITDDLAAPADAGAAAVTPLDMSDSARLLAALASGDDPFGILEATAAIAGEAGGEDGGGSFVRLLRILEPTDPLDLAYPRLGRVEEELPRLSGLVMNAATSPNNSVPGITIEDGGGNPVTGRAAGSVWESGLPGGTQSGVTNTQTSGTFTTTHTGTDTLAKAEVQDKDGEWREIDLTSGATTTVQGKYGTLVVKANGSWTYTLDGATSDHDGFNQTGAADQVEDAFALRVTDSDGDVATGDLKIAINDDGPIAQADVNTVKEDTVLTASGNVIAGETGTNNGADDPGADTPVTVTGVIAGVLTGNATSTSGSVGTDITGTYGTLKLNADGSYTYTLNNNSAAVQALNNGQTEQDVFTYTITDADGDTSTTTLTINVEGVDDGPPTINIEDVDGTVSPGANSVLEDTGNTVTGTVTVSAEAGIATVSVGGVVLFSNGTVTLPPPFADTGKGILTITGYNPATGVISYSYEETGGRDDHSAGDDTVFDSFVISVTDITGTNHEDNLIIHTLDTNPDAVDDEISQAAENQSVTVNVLTNDTAVDGIANLATDVKEVPNSLTGTGTLTYNNDGTFTYAPGPGEEGDVTFKYTIKDADGDTSNEATVTIHLKKDSKPELSSPGGGRGGHGIVEEMGLASGSQPDYALRTASNAFTINTGNDALGQMKILDKDGNDISIDLTPGAVTTVYGQYGTLTVTVGINHTPSNPAISWHYELTTHTTTHSVPGQFSLNDTVPEVFDVRVYDNDGDAAQLDLTILIGDDRPEALTDTGYTITASGPNVIDGNVLDNDHYYADGEHATNAFAWNGDPAVITEASQYGTLELNTDGTWKFTLDVTKQAFVALTEGETKTFQIPYTITDGDGDTATSYLEFAVIGVNDAPQLIDQQATGWEDTPITGNVLNGATDADGDSLTVTQFTVNGQTANADGTITISGVGTLTIASTGSYTFTPAANWNGKVPQVTYTVSDGSGAANDTQSATLDITVKRTGDAPESADGHANETEGKVYTFTVNDFAKLFADPIDAGFEGADAFTAVIIGDLSGLPAGVTMELNVNGVSTTVQKGDTISKADIEAGHLTIKTPSVTGDQALGNNGQIQFDFKVQDKGNTDHGGVNTSQSYEFTLTVDQFIAGGNKNNNDGGNADDASVLRGGAGDDVILGDAGGIHTIPEKGVSYNIALVLDVSTSMTDPQYGGVWGNPPRTRLQTAKEALKSLISNQLLAHVSNEDGTDNPDVNINITVITFPGNQTFKLVGLNASNIDSILNAIGTHDYDNPSNNSGLMPQDGGTPYTPAFTATKTWFDELGSNSAYDDYENMTFFLTDGHPNNDGGEAARLQAFKELANVSPVHAIGIGDSIPKAVLDAYDTTPIITNVPDAATPNSLYANFNNNSGVNNANNWDIGWNGEGLSGSRARNNNRLRITNISSDPDLSVKVTMSENYKMIVTDTTHPGGAYFRFDAARDNWRNNDLFTWRLLKWDADANDWIVAEEGNQTGNNITTSLHGAGEYRLQFEVNDRSSGGGQARIRIDNIHIYRSKTVGDAKIVLEPDDLDAALIAGGQFTNPAPVGDDVIYGGDGDDILFGDAINTSNLPWDDVGGKPLYL